jgi:hypothetical protein
VKPGFIPLIAAAVAATVLAFGGALVANAQEDTGTVTVIHGVPGLMVDVYVNGDLTLEGFEPDTITDSLSLPAGDYDIEIFAAGADPEAEEPAISGSASLPAGANASIIAHLSEDGAPMLSVFVNDVSPVDAGNARLVVRHTAAAPAVDVLADGTAVFTDLANPDEASADVPAGDYSAAVAAAGTTDPVIGPADLTLDAGTAYFVYAVGSLEDDTLNLLVQTVSGLGATDEPEPEATPETQDLPPAGTGGAIGSSSTSWALWFAAGLAAAGLLAGLGAARFASVRSRR